MKRLIGIAVAFFLTYSVNAQEFKVDTLYTGLKNATSFLIANDAIYIVERGNHRILKLDLNGKLIEKYGNRGSANYQFDTPTDITSSTGLKIFVSDPENNRIQVFDKRWQYLSSIKGNEKFRTRDEISPEYIGVNRLGEIFFFDSRSKLLGKYDEDGAYLDQIPLPSEIKDVSALQISDSKIFILDKKSELIHRLSENGFYESFYPAKDVTSFFNAAQTLYTSTNYSIKKQERQDFQTVFTHSEGFVVNDFIVIDSSVYLLTGKELIRVLIK